MKFKLYLCDQHAHELEQQFGTDAVKVEGKVVRWLPSICQERSCAEKLHSASFEVIFNAGKAIE